LPQTQTTSGDGIQCALGRPAQEGGMLSQGGEAWLWFIMPWRAQTPSTSAGARHQGRRPRAP
jgi:hypothetical protein